MTKTDTLDKLNEITTSVKEIENQKYQVDLLIDSIENTIQSLQRLLSTINIYQQLESPLHELRNKIKKLGE
jgi:predicted  nucleic acid-binding Zn-ribbon protein